MKAAVILTLILLLQSLSHGKAFTEELGLLPYSRTEAKSGNSHSRITHRFEKHQYAETAVSVNPDGQVIVNTQFENGKRIDGDHFYCRFELLDVNGKPVAVTRQEAGVDPQKKRTLRNEVRLDQATIARLHSVRVTYGHFDKVDDLQFWKKVEEAAKVIGVISGDFVIFR